jgi:hypothetical protein
MPGRVDLERLGHALLGDEHRAADRQRQLDLNGRADFADSVPAMA